MSEILLNRSKRVFFLVRGGRERILSLVMGQPIDNNKSFDRALVSGYCNPRPDLSSSIPGVLMQYLY